ncbi:Ankyrin repeat domain-containing protein 10 [Mytilus coruscus]|uniref:Ankyrin repeat domain-containing protein 10 n=1 Tax=Mytilus coruscus TaxID=42192 RepID=A0A6J8BK85_MYTCO|nr:Ankyrin repeat domain-containing protein 10 [Mytilus coruscus]
MEDEHESGNWSPTSEDLLESHYPLHRACRDGDLEAMSLLLSNGPDFYQEDGLYGWTPIHWAANFGKFTCLMRLIEQGCNCDYSTERLNQTPLHMAAHSGKGHCLKWLLHSGAAINRQDYMGETALHKAARTGNMECISLLISQGTKLLIKNHNGQIPSQLAAACGYQECAAYIERAAQTEHAQGVYGLPTYNPSNEFTQNSQVVTNGNAMESDDDMETDLSVLPEGHRVNPLAGTKRSRDDCDEEECKKSRRDEPEHWSNQNGFLQNTNGFSHHDNYQNGFIKNQMNGYNNHINGTIPNGINQHCNGKVNNGFLQFPNLFSQNGSIKNQNGLPQMDAESLPVNNNSICISTSTEEHYSSINQQQGYDSLLVQSLGNQYDGS